MAGSQISTSVTIISSLLGFNAVSLSALTTSSVPSVLAGSKLEVAGAFYTWGTDELPNASSWTAIATASSAYLQCTPSGSAGSQILTTSYTGTAPTWSTSKQGWYTSTGSSIRVIARITKQSATEYASKTILRPENREAIWSFGSTDPGGTFDVVNSNGVIMRFTVPTIHSMNMEMPATVERIDFTNGARTITALSILGTTGVVTAGYGINTDGTALKTKVLSIGEWNMDVTANVSVAHGLSSALDKICNVQVLIVNDAGTSLKNLQIGKETDPTDVSGFFVCNATNVELYRDTGGAFDSTDYNATVSTVANRGFVTILYRA